MLIQKTLTSLMLPRTTIEARFEDGRKIIEVRGKRICRQPSPMSNASGMLRMLDLVSLARLAG